MGIKLCYKDYDWKLTIGAIKSFRDKTGKDLYGVFAKYITASINLHKDVSIFERNEIFRDLNSRETACQALYFIIKDAQDGVSLDEILDGALRVNWQLSDRPDDLSNPWPVVMLETAWLINEYNNNNIPKKKADTSEV